MEHIRVRRDKYIYILDTRHTHLIFTTAVFIMKYTIIRGLVFGHRGHKYVLTIQASMTSLPGLIDITTLVFNNESSTHLHVPIPQLTVTCLQNADYHSCRSKSENMFILYNIDPCFENHVHLINSIQNIIF